MLPAPLRTEVGHRVFGPKETRILAFIRRGRELGFTLDQIRALLNLGRGRRHAPRGGRSLIITSKPSPQRLTILLSLNACCVRRSRNVLAGRHQIAPCWICSMSKASGHPTHSAGWFDLTIPRCPIARRRDFSLSRNLYVWANVR